MVFSKGKTRQKCEFKLQNKTLEIVDIIFSLISEYNGNFNKTRRTLAHQAQ